MWQSVFEHIEEMESTEAELEQILKQKGQYDKPIANETVDVQFEEAEEAGALNATFTKAQIEVMDATYENSMLFNSFQESNGGLVEPGNNTPVPKKLHRAKKKSERIRNLINHSVQTLPTVLELENETF